MASRELTGSRSEYSGETRDNTILAKRPGATLQQWERLRLMHLTGKPDDVESKVDRRIWDGWEVSPNSVMDFDD